MSRNPKEALDAGTRHLRNALTYSQRNGSPGSIGETLRTTVTIRPNLHSALRILAATRGCRLNDLLVVAIEDLLVQQGALPGTVSRCALRQRLKANGLSNPSEGPAGLPVEGDA